MSIHCKACGGHLGSGLVSVSVGVRLLGTSRSTLYRRQSDPGYPKIYADKFGGRRYLKTSEISSYLEGLIPIKDGGVSAESRV